MPPGKANYPRRPRLAHAGTLTARPGVRVQLSAEGSSDPDGDPLSCRWFYWMPPGTGTMHIILAVTDHGTPRLTRYRRVRVTVDAGDPARAPD